MLPIGSNILMERQQVTGVIRKIHLYIRYGELKGIRFYDATGTLIYESAFKRAFIYTKHEIILEEGEKIIGFISRQQTKDCAVHDDFQFIIGSI